MANQIQTVETKVKPIIDITIEKKATAKKTAAKKTATKSAAGKKATSKKTVAKKAVSKVTVKYNVVARPGSGALLKAHTAAMFKFFNMITVSRKAADLSHVRQIWGDTAIGYHTRIGNIKKSEGKVQLTAKGYNFFTDRKKAAHYDEDVMGGYLAIMQGKAPSKTAASQIGGYKLTVNKG